MKIKFITICILVILSSVFSINAQTTIELFPDYDAAIGYHDNFNTENNNYGTAFQNAAYAIPGASGGINVNRALINFDLTNIPSGATVTSAKLNLYALGQTGSFPGHTGPNNNSILQRVIENWTENTVTWNTQPATTNVNEVHLPASNNALQDYTDIDVTLLVQDMIANNNYGFLLKLENEDATNAILFASKNNGDSTKYPLLRVTYDNCLTIVSNTDAAIGYHDNFNTENNNYGTAFQNAAYTIPGASGGINVNRALINFDLSNIPSGVTITSANLNLYALGQTGSFPGHTGLNNNSILQRVIENWTENTVTWNTQPATTNVNEVHLPASNNALQDYTNIDVTLLVQDMIANNNYGFLLKLENEETINTLLFCSSDYFDTSKHPKIEVCFSQPSGVNENSQNVDFFNIYPNPSSGIVNVNVNSLQHEEKAVIEIFSINGVKVKSKDIHAGIEEIDLKNLTSGIYFMKLIVRNQTITKKFILSNDN